MFLMLIRKVAVLFMPPKFVEILCSSIDYKHNIVELFYDYVGMHAAFEDFVYITLRIAAW